MEHETTWSSLLALRVGVDGVTDERVPQVKHVDTYLVGTPRVERAEDKRGICGSVRAEDIPVSNRRFAGTRIDHGHFESIDRMATNVGKDRARGLLRHTLDHG
jgi:hypothetical protein